jgi:hypothetical protein
LSGGDRKALQKELVKSRAMTRIFAEHSEEKRRVGEALLREAGNLGRLPSFLLNPSRLRPARVLLFVLFKNATACSGHRLN